MPPPRITSALLRVVRKPLLLRRIPLLQLPRALRADGSTLIPERKRVHATKGIHVGRATGGDRRHRHPDRPVVAGGSGRTGGGPAGPGPTKPQANRPASANVPR